MIPECGRWPGGWVEGRKEEAEEAEEEKEDEEVKGRASGMSGKVSVRLRINVEDVEEDECFSCQIDGKRGEKKKVTSRRPISSNCHAKCSTSSTPSASTLNFLLFTQPRYTLSLSLS